MKEIYEVGEAPPVGEVPRLMYAQVVRRDRFGEPRGAFRVEKIAVPPVGPGEALVYVMAAGVNYNNVWAALGRPVDVIAARNREGQPEDFHVGGSDASGIVYAVGSDVKNVRVGDPVVVHCGVWDPGDPAIQAGVDPIVAPSNKIWGYETNWGSFAQFARVQAHQCMPKAPHLLWEEAAAPTLVGATAYRMLFGWPPHTVRKGDVVLVWGGSGGLGSMAIQLVKQAGGVPVAVVSSEDKFDYCVNLGARGCVNRKKFSHWGVPPHWKETEAYGTWLQGARAFGKAVWDAVGERRSPRIVFEHPGEDTVPTSLYVVDRGGMVVICAGTSGYTAVADLRYLWMHQKRLQGSHFANDEQSYAFNRLVVEKKISPCLSRVFPFGEIPLAHQLMYENKHPPGNMVCTVGAPQRGLRGVP